MKYLVPIDKIPFSNWDKMLMQLEASCNVTSYINHIKVYWKKACKVIDMGWKIFHDLCGTDVSNKVRAKDLGQAATKTGTYEKMVTRAPDNETGCKV